MIVNIILYLQILSRLIVNQNYDQRVKVSVYRT